MLNSWRWRLENLYSIEDKDGKLIPFKPNRAQTAFFSNMHRGGNAILKARQLGMSTGIVMWILNKLVCNANMSAGIVDKTLTDAEAKIRKVKIAFENLDNQQLPFWQVGELVKRSISIVSSSSLRIEFSNGSSLQAGRSLRGGTVQLLHISELGKIAMEEPQKAEEIRTGALNTISPGGENFVFVESTHEGGRIGMHYRLMDAAMKNDPERLTPVDMKFHFYPWFWDDAYSVDPLLVKLRPEMVEYFEMLRTDFSIELSAGQKAWYDRKEVQQGQGMKKEFPSTPGEAFESAAQGAIYAKWISEARAEGRILDFVPAPNIPVIVGMDLGVSDYTSMWAMQFVGREIHWVDWYENSRKAPEHYAGVLREWDRKYNNIAQIYLPHDAGYQEKSGSSYVQYLADCGITNMTVVPRTPDIWQGINNLRDMLKRSVFHATNCGTPRVDDGGEECPSGIDCLEAYRTGGTNSAGVVKETPIHDLSSHSCDAARTLSEAFARGMIGHEGTVPSLQRRGFKPVVITGGGRSDYGAQQRVRTL